MRHRGVYTPRLRIAGVRPINKSSAVCAVLTLDCVSRSDLSHKHTEVLQRLALVFSLPSQHLHPTTSRCVSLGAVAIFVPSRVSPRCGMQAGKVIDHGFAVTDSWR
eukprot:GFYU01053201.1.p1 GENE.GFYU01053201.1~~GFYU01053201.1.p1  ORF type:complete len:106 (+),score=3.96 GFYU01053201.1:51-368(+)